MKHLIPYIDQVSLSIKMSVKNRNVNFIFKKRAQVLRLEDVKAPFLGEMTYAFSPLHSLPGHVQVTGRNERMRRSPHGSPGTWELGCRAAAAWGHVPGQSAWVWPERSPKPRACHAEWVSNLRGEQSTT